MSVNVYDKESDKLSPLTSAFSTLAIVDVATVPTENILDVIYRVSVENWDFHSVALYSSDMASNKANLEAIGFEESISGDDYIYTPNNKKIRYLSNQEECDIDHITINSTNGHIVILSTSLSTLLDTTIIDGVGYPFYNASEWASTNLTLSSSDMEINTNSFESIGFYSSTDNITHTYHVGDKSVRYNENTAENTVSKIVIVDATGEMTIYGTNDTIIFNGIIVDGPYTFFYTDAVSYWVGNSSEQSVERLATYGNGGGGGTSNVNSLQDIFNTNPDQVINGSNNVMTFVDNNESISVDPSAIGVNTNVSNLDIEADQIELSHTTSGSKITDFKVNASKITMSEIIRNTLKTDLDIYDVEEMITGIESDATSASKDYAVNDLLISEDVLYKVTATISIGDALTVGTNIAAVTIEDLLKLKQNKTLDTPLKIDSETTNATTVEGALGLLNTKKINVSEKGADNGVATLNNTGKVPASQLPSYVDDVIEGYYNEDDGKFYETYTESFDAVTPVGTENPSEEGWYEFDGTNYIPTEDETVDSGKTYYELVRTWEDEISGETGKIYVDLLTEKSYRWSGTVFVNIGSSLALGETSETAYRGDRGKIAYDDSQSNKATIAKILTDIAIVDKPVAESAHAIDDLIIVNDQLYKVTSPIAIGDTITVGTNVEIISIKSALEDKLDSLVNLPTASATYLGKLIHYKGATTSTLTKGYIYECKSETDPDTGDVTYNWVPTINIVIDDELNDESINPVQNKVVKEALDKKQDYVFRGTHAEWEALTTDEKAKYDLVAFTDDTCVDGDAYIAGSVVEGDYNAVSSDAVAKEIGSTDHTANGNIIELDLDKATVAKHTVITFEANQPGSGDPSPTNARPIFGFKNVKIVSCGKNICPTIESGTYEISSAKTSRTDRVRSSDFIVYKKGETITISESTSVSGKSFEHTMMIFECADFINNKRINSIGWNTDSTFSFDTDGYVLYIGRYSDGSDIDPNDVQIQLEYGTTVTSYEPYSEASNVVINSDETIYYGTLDVEKGELIVTRRGFDLGSVMWEYNSTKFWTTLSGINAPVYNETTELAPNAICSHYAIATTVQLNSAAGNLHFGLQLGNELQVHDDRYTNVNDFKAAVSGIIAVYELANPIVYKLTGAQINLIAGHNVVLAGGSSTNLTYGDGKYITKEDLHNLNNSINSLASNKDVIYAEITFGINITTANTPSELNVTELVNAKIPNGYKVVDIFAYVISATPCICTFTSPAYEGRWYAQFIANATGARTVKARITMIKV